MPDIVPNIVVSQPAQLFTLARSFKANANGKIYIGKLILTRSIRKTRFRYTLKMKMELMFLFPNHLSSMLPDTLYTMVRLPNL